MARCDLLEFLPRYRATPRRRLWRVERWRRRGWRRDRVAAAAEELAAKLLAHGVGAGDRVGVYVKDGPLWAASLFGVLRCGAVAVPIDVAHPPELVERLASRLRLAAWIGDAELPIVDLGIPSIEVDWSAVPANDRLGPSAGPSGMPRLPDDDGRRVAEVVLTSGTTSEPQAVEVRHENLRAVLDALEEEIAGYRWLIRLAPRLRLAVTLPLSHLYGQVMGVLLPVALDADVAIIGTMPAAELAAAVRGEGARALVSVPHTLSSLLHHLLDEGRRAWGADGFERRLRRAENLSWPRRWWLFDRLRRRLGRRLVALVSGGARLDPEVERLWKLLGYVVVQGYGLTEAAPLVALNHPLRARQGSIGRPLPGVEVRIAADGEILVRGRNVATPSTHGPQIDPQGWLHTGDLGEELDDGSIRFRGRSSDRIVTPAGVNVDPAEVAAALRAAACVVDAAVIERPWGEPGTLCAVLVLVPGTDAAAVVRRTNRGLADPARVRSWFAWPGGDLPRTPTGKVRRGEVLAWLQRQAPAGSSGVAAPVDRVLAAIAGAEKDRPAKGEGPTGEGGAPPAGDVRIGELLSSLDRVELAGRLENLYGVSPGDALFTGEQSIGELAAMLRDAAGGRSIGAQMRAVEGGPSPSRHRAPSAPGPSAPSASPGAGDRLRNGAPGAPATAGDRVRSGEAQVRGAARRKPDAAPWRHRLPARAGRWILRECFMHPLGRLLVRIEAESATAIGELDAPFLLAANHTSLLDPLVQFALPARLRARLAPAARWNFFTDHPQGAFLYLWGVLGLNLFPLVQSGDWRPTLRIGGDLADRGHSLLIYPEGRISEDGAVHELKLGVAVMSRDLHLPIVPCATAGLELVLPPGRRRPRRQSWRRPVVGVCIGEPLPAARSDADLDELVDELAGRLRHLHERAVAIRDRRGASSD